MRNSLKSRYLFKLGTNFLVVPLNLISISVITRALGPELFGQYKYLIYFFTLIASFIGFGGNYFNTELSKDNFNKTLISFYQNFILLSWFGGALMVLVIGYAGWTSAFFPDIVEIRYIWIAFVLSFVTFISQVLESMTDSCGLTENASIFNFLSKLLGVGALCTLVFLFNLTNLPAVFLYSFSIAVLTITGFSIILKVGRIPIFYFRISTKEFKANFYSFFTYSHPLLLLSIFSLVFGFFNRWILQYFSGSLQMGYFSLSDTFSAFIIIFSNSFIPLLHRDLAINFNERDLERMKILFQKSLMIFTAITSYLSAFIFLNITFITSLIGGVTFEDSIHTSQIMLLYPIAYIANNILYAVLYATGKTPVLRNVQIFIVVLNSITTYFLVAPTSGFGLQLGAFGFAISMVLVTYLNHFILLKYCGLFFDLSWVSIVINYLKIIIVFLSGAVLSTFLFSLIFKSSLLGFLLSGFFYTIITAYLLFRFPGLVFFSTNETEMISRLVFKFLKKDK